MKYLGHHPLFIGRPVPFVVALLALVFCGQSFVAAAPLITTQPQAQTVTAGTPVSLTVVASGAPALTYQWKKGIAAIPGANAATFSIALPRVADAGTYSVDVTDGTGTAASSPAVLTVNPAVLTVGANDITIYSGTPVATVVAQGLATYAGFFGNDTVAVVSGTVTFTTTYTPASAGGAKEKLSPVVTGLTAVDYTFLAKDGRVDVIASPPPVIQSAPQSRDVALGASVTLSVTPGSVTPVTYQWRKGGVAISGATDQTYTIPSFASGDAGSYDVVVQSYGGSVTSPPAALAVAVSPVIATQPQSQTVASGGSATFTVAATGSTPFTYQWSKGSTPIAGATNASYTINTAAVADSGSTYSVVVTNVAGSATSSPAVLTVNPPAPVIASATSATATVGVPFSYQITTANNIPATFTAAGLPVGLSLDPATGVISGTPTTAGSSTVTLTATNLGGTSPAVTLTVTVGAAVPPTLVQAAATVTTTAGTAVSAVTPVTASGAVPPYSFSVSPALPAGLQLSPGTGEITGTPAANAFVPPFAGGDDFSVDSGAAKWAGAYRTLGSAAANGQLAVDTTAGRLDFSKGAGEGSQFRRWDGDPQVAGSSRTTASFATGWRAEVTVTNGATVTGAEYSSVGVQVVANGGWAAMMVTRTASGLSVRGESSSIAFASSPSAVIASGTGVRLRLGWDAATRTLKGAYSTDAGASYTELLTLGSTTWAGSSSAGFYQEVFANSTIAGAVAAGANYLDDFKVAPTTPNTAVHTVTVTDSVGGTATSTFALTVNPPAPVIASATSATATVGVPFSYQITTANNIPASFTATGLPVGLSLDPATGVISGTPTTAGTSSVTLTATNAGGTSPAVTLTVTVGAAVPPTLVQAAATVTTTAGTAVTAVTPVTASGAVPPYSFSVSPALPAGLQLSPGTGEITGTPAANAFVPPFAGGDDFSADSGAAKWAGAYRTLGSAAANGQLAVDTTAGRLDFSKGAGEGSQFRRWDGDPQVAGSSRTTASFATGWRAEVTVTNGATVTGAEYSSVGVQVVANGGWAAMMVTRTASGLSVRGESSSIAFASSPSAVIASGTGVRLRLMWDAAAKALKGAYSTDAGASYTELLTLGSTTWAGSSSAGFYQEVFANSTIAGAVAAGANYLDDFKVAPTTPNTAVHTVTVTDSVGGTATSTFALTVNPPAPVIASATSATATVGVPFSYQITTANNIPATFTAAGLPVGLSLDPATGVISGTPTTAGSSTVTLTATNLGGTSPAVTLAVLIGKGTPTITTPPTAGGITYGQTLAASTLSGGAASVGGTFAFTNPATAPGAGTASQGVTFTPSDSANYNNATTTTSVAVAKVNQTITFGALPVKTVGDTTFTLGATATSGGVVTYTSSNTAVATINGNTVTIVGAGTTTVTAKQAGDANYNAAPDVTQTLTVNPPAPVIASGTSATATVGVPFSYQITTANNIPASFTAMGLPGGLSLDPATGVISGTPTTAGSSTVTLTATNTGGTSPAVTLTLTVYTLPSVTTQPQPVTVVAGAPATFSVSASGSSPLQYQWRKTGVAIPGATGASFTLGSTSLADAGSYSVTVSNSAGSVSSNTALLTVNPSVAASFTVTASAATYSAAGGQITFNVAMSFPVGTLPAFAAKPPGVDWIYVSDSGTNVPPLKPATGEVTDPTDPLSKFGFTYLSPPAVGTGSFSFVVSYPAGLSGNQTFTFAANYRVIGGALTEIPVPVITLTMPVPPAPVIASGTSATATVGVPFSYQITTANNIPATFTAAGLPVGLSLDPATGVISGTPTTAGSSTVTLTATNAGGTSPAVTLTVTVGAAVPPTLVQAAATVTTTAGTAVTAVTPVTASGAVPPYSFSVSPALPAGLQLSPGTGEITGTPAANAFVPPFAGGDDFSVDSGAAKWAGAYRTLGSAAANGQLAVDTTAGRLDFSKGAGEGSQFRRWDGDPQVAGSSRTTASFATGWRAEVTVTNGATVTGAEYSSVGVQVVANGGWAAMMVTRTASGLSVRGESSSIAFASSPSAVIASGTGVRLRLMWDAAAKALKGAYSTDAGASYTELLTLGSTTWAGSSSAGFYQEVFANSTIAGAVAAGANYLDDFKVAPTTPNTAVHTVTVTDSVGGTATSTFALTVNPPAPVIASATSATATVGVPFSYQITTANNIPATFTAAGLPVGLSLDPATGVISGTPTTAGSSTVTLTATNTGGTSPAVTLAVTVGAAVVQPIVLDLSTTSQVQTVKLSALPPTTFPSGSTAGPKILVRSVPISIGGGAINLDFVISHAAGASGVSEKRVELVTTAVVQPLVDAGGRLAVVSGDVGATAPSGLSWQPPAPADSPAFVLLARRAVVGATGTTTGSWADGAARTFGFRLSLSDGTVRHGYATVAVGDIAGAPALTLFGVAVHPTSGSQITVPANPFGVLGTGARTLSIDAVPDAAAVWAGNSATFTLAATANGGGPSYQWLFNGQPVAGGTAASFTRAPATVADAGGVSALVEVPGGGLSALVSARLDVHAISPQPQPLAVQVSQSATFSTGVVTSRGDSAFGFQWYKRGVAVVGATAKDYQFFAAAGDDQADVFARVTDIGFPAATGSRDSNTVLLTVAAGAGGGGSPAISAVNPNPVQPGASLSVAGVNFPASGTVSASIGGVGLTNVLLGSTGILANVPSNVPTGSQTLTVVLPGSITVTAPVQVGAGGGTAPQYSIAQFNPQPVAAGGLVTLTGMFPTGVAPVVTLENGGTTPVATLTAGTNTASQVTATVPAGTPDGTYGLKVAFGASGTAVVLTVPQFTVGTGGGTAPQVATISSQPQSQSVAVGLPVTFTVAAAGSAPFTYQWSKGSSPIANATNAIYTINAVSTADAGSYSVVVTNAGGSVTSASAVLTVNLPAVLSSGPGAATVVPDGSRVALGVVAVSPGAATYAWSKDTAAVGGGTVQYAFGASVATAGNYGLSLNGAGLSSTPISVGGSGSQVRFITGMPDAVHVQSGRNVVLGLSAYGGTGLAFSWTKDGAVLAGRTDNALDLGTVGSVSSGRYTLTAQLGTDATTRATSSTRLVTGAAGDALLYGPSGGPAVLGSPLAINGSIVPGDGATVVWERKPVGSTSFSAVATGAGSPYSVTTGPAVHTLNISAVTAGMAGDEFRFVATRGGVSFTSEPYVLLGGGVTPAMNVEGVVRSWSIDVTKTGAVVNGVTYNVWTRISSGFGTYANNPTPPANWGRVLGTGQFSSLAGETGITFKFGELVLNDPAFVSGGTAGSGGITVQEYLPFPGQPTPVEFYDATGAVLATGTMQKLITRVVFTTGAATGEGRFTLTAAGASAKSAAFLQELNQLTGGTGQLHFTIGSYLALSGTNSYYDYLSSGTISPVAPVPPAITTPPQAQTVTAGAGLTFSVVAAGTPPFSYQWIKDNADIPNATNATYAIAAATVADAGSYSVKVTNNLGNLTSATALLTVNKATPTITTPPTAGGIAYGQTLAASTLSGGAASVAGTFAFTNPATAPGAGTASQGVTFTPADTANYNVATTTTSVAVAKATPTITTPPTAGGIMYGQTLAASTLSGGAASVAGTFAFTNPAAAPGAGTASQGVTFTPADTANYNVATTTTSVAVAKATPTITTPPTAGGIAYGQTLAASTLSGGAASVAGTFAFTNPAAAPGAGTASQGVTFTPADTANYNVATTTTSVAVAKANQTITFGALPVKTVGDTTFTLGATATSGGVVTYTSSNTAVATINGNTVTIVGAGTATVTAKQAGDANYNAAPDVTQTLTVNPPAPVIASATSATATVGVPFSYQITTANNIPATFTAAGLSVGLSLDPATGVISGTPTTAGSSTVTLTATNPGGTSPAVTLTVTVGAAVPPTLVQAAATVTTTAGTAVTAVTPVTASGAVPPYSFSVSPALPAGLQLSPGTGEITGTPAANAFVPPFAGGDDFSADSGAAKWAGAYRTLGSAAANGQLAVDTTAGRLDFSKGAGEGSQFRRWDGDPQVAGSSRTTASFATGWRAEVTVTNGATVTGAEYSSVGVQVVANGGWAAMMVTRTASGLSVRGESSSIAFASSPSAVIASGTGVRLRLMWDAAAKALKGAYSTDAGASYTELLTLGSTTWAGSSSAGFYQEVFANSTIAGAVAAGANYLDDFKVAPTTPNTAVHTVTVTDSVGGTATSTFALTVNPPAPVIASATSATATVGVPFSYQITTANNIPATFTAAGLPVGLSLDPATGVISGTPTTAGSSTVTLTATNPGGTSPAVTLAVLIGKGTPTITTAPTAGGITYGQTLAASTLNGGAASVGGTFAFTNPAAAPGAGTASQGVTFTPSDSANYNNATTTTSVSVAKAEQTITFGTVAAKTFGDAAFALGATATSGGTVTYTSSNPSVATVSGNTVTIVGAGTTTLTAKQAGDANYNAAPDVTQTLNVAKVAATVAITPATLAQTYTGAPRVAAATTIPAGLNVIITYQPTGGVAGQVAPISAGSYAVTATIESPNHQGSATGTLNVAKADQTITFGTLPGKTASDAAFNLGATATSGGAVTYTSSNPGVATVSGNTVTIVGVGTTVFTAKQAGDANYNAAPDATQPFSVGKGTPVITTPPVAGGITYGQTLAASTLSGGAASVAGTFAFTSPATAPGAGTASQGVTFTPADTANYNVATTTTNVAVAKADQTITFTAPAAKTYGDGTFTLSATSSSGGAVSFSSSNPAVATMAGNTVTIAGAGTISLVARQAGDANYNAAPDVTQTLSVARRPLSIQAKDDAKVYGAVKTYGTSVAFTSQGLVPGQSIGSVTITATGGAAANSPVGTYDLMPSAAAGGTFLAANYDITYVKGVLTVSKFAVTGSFVAQNKTYDGSTSATVTSTSLTGVSAGDVVTLSGGIAAFQTPGVGNGKRVDLTGASLAGANAVNYVLTSVDPASANITPKALTVAGLSVADKTYDGTTAATLSGTPVLQGAVGGDDVVLSGTPAGAFANAGAGSGKGVAVSGLSLSGAAAVNYSLTVPSLSANVTKANQTLTIVSVLQRAASDPDFTIDVSASSKLTAFTYSSSNPAVATISASGVIDLLAQGTTTITVNQPGDTNFNAASVTGTLTVVASGQTLVWDATGLSGKKFGDAPITLSATATSNLPVTFTSSNPAVAAISGNTLTITGAGTADIIAKQVGDAAFGAAEKKVSMTVAKAPATVTLSSLTATYDGTPKAVSAVTTPSGLKVNLLYGAAPGTTTAPTSAGTYAVSATIDDNNYTGGDSSRTLVIAKAAQTIAFTAPATKSVADPAYALGATATSGLPVSYVSSNPLVASVVGNTLTPRAAGSVTITARQGGNENFSAATDVGQALTVEPLLPDFTIPAASAVALQGGSFLFGPVSLNPLSAPATFSASANLPAGLKIDAATGNISGVPTAGTGTAVSVTITATNSKGSSSKSVSILVQPPAPVITSAAAAVATAGQAFTYQTIVTPLSGLTFAVSPSTAPAGWNALAISGSGVLTGTPVAGGTYVFTITATNATGSASLPLVVTVALPSDAPSYAGITNPSATAGTAFSFTPNFGTSAQPTTYALSGTLPTGLNFNAGVISGTTQVTGSFPISITATRGLLSATANLTLVVNPAANAPVAIVGGGSVRTATVGSLFSVTVTADPEPTGFTISPAALTEAGLAAGVFNNVAKSIVISGTPTKVGTFQIPIVAQNTAGGGQPTLLVLTVNPHPEAPQVVSTPSVTARVGEPMTPFTLAAKSAGTDIAPPNVTFALLGSLPAGLGFDGSTGVLSGQPSVGTTGSYKVLFSATKVGVLGATGLGLEVTINVLPPLSVPEITSNGSAAGQVGQAFTYAISATNTPTAFNAAPLPAGLTLNGGVISGVPTTATGASPFKVTLSASNGDGTGNPKELSIAIAPAPATPVVTSALSATGRVGLAFSYKITASETPTSYVALNLPAGLALDVASGQISGSPTQAGTFTATIRAANAAGLGAAESLALAINPAPSAPVVSSPPTSTGEVGVQTSYQITATPAPITSYSVAGNLPAGLTLNSSTGLIKGSPTQAGTFGITVAATGEGGTSLPQSVIFTISPSALAPVITSPGTAAGNVGSAFSYQIDATNAPLVTRDAVNLPPGLVVNPFTGQITGTPAVVGTTVASLVATNGVGAGPIRDLTIVIGPSLSAPVVTGALSVSAQVGVSFSYAITASGTPTSYELTGAPAWMLLNTATGVVSGTPTAPGSFAVSALARNAAGVSAPFPLTVNVAPASGTPVIVSSQTASGTVGVPFVKYTIASDPPALSYLAAGLPPGLIINGGTGEITGTPTASGSFPVSIFGVNAKGQGGTVKVTITIAPSITFGN